MTDLKLNAHAWWGRGHHDLPCANCRFVLRLIFPAEHVICCAYANGPSCSLPVFETQESHHLWKLWCFRTKGEVETVTLLYKGIHKHVEDQRGKAIGLRSSIVHWYIISSIIHCKRWCNDSSCELSAKIANDHAFWQVVKLKTTWNKVVLHFTTIVLEILETKWGTVRLCCLSMGKVNKIQHWCNMFEHSTHFRNEALLNMAFCLSIVNRNEYFLLPKKGRIYFKSYRLQSNRVKFCGFLLIVDKYSRCTTPRWRYLFPEHDATASLSDILSEYFISQAWVEELCIRQIQGAYKLSKMKVPEFSRL